MNENSQTTILLVDDDEDFLLQHKTLLEAAGFLVRTAGGQVEAEKMLAEQLPDLAIIDLMMEHHDDGFALCHHIKKLDTPIPVILVTAVAHETGLEFDAAGEEERAWIKADAMLAKPIRFEQLTREINRLLGRL